MKKLILALTILCSFLGVGRAGAGVCSFGHFYCDLNDLARATGTVTSTGLNSIAIYDEDRKRVERFIDLNEGQRFHKGDYIRIFYHPQGAIVAIIKRMTVLEYKQNGQNLGDIFHQASS